VKVEVAQYNSKFRVYCERLVNEVLDRVTKKRVFPAFDMPNNSRRKKYFGTKCITINLRDDSDSNFSNVEESETHEDEPPALPL
jgi:hypothetical protein